MNLDTLHLAWKQKVCLQAHVELNVYFCRNVKTLDPEWNNNRTNLKSTWAVSSSNFWHFIDAITRHNTGSRIAKDEQVLTSIGEERKNIFRGKFTAANSHSASVLIVRCLSRSVSKITLFNLFWQKISCSQKRICIEKAKFPHGDILPESVRVCVFICVHPMESLCLWNRHTINFCACILVYKCLWSSRLWRPVCTQSLMFSHFFVSELNRWD